MDAPSISAIFVIIIILTASGGTAFGQNATAVSSSISLDETIQEMAIDRFANKIYAASASGHVYVIDTTTNRLIANMEIDGVPRGIDVNINTGLVYIANGELVYVIDGNMNKITATIKAGNSPADVAVNPQTNLIYVSNWNYPYGGFSVIDGSTNEVIYNVEGLGGSSSRVAVNSNANMIYMTNFALQKDTPNVLSVIDGSNNRIMYNVTIGFGRGGVETLPGTIKRVPIEVSPVTNTVYVADINSESLVVLNGSTNKISQRLDDFPVADIAIDEDNNIVYSVQAGSGVTSGSKLISIINGTNNNVINAVEIDDIISRVGINSETGLIYAATYAPEIAIQIVESARVVPEFPFIQLTVLISIAALVALFSVQNRLRQKY